MSRLIYDDAFFEGIDNHSLNSARLIVPMLLELVQPSSVLDVGCGRGTWLLAFKEGEVKHVHGLDGEYVDRSKLLIDADCFSVVDLRSPSFNIAGRYDLALCLEVAEHLPIRAGDRLVQALTQVAPIVVFSAAVPGQGGKHHINEQWPSYWKERFSRHGFQMIDAVRPRIRDDPRIAWFYRQNMLLFASGDAIRANAMLQQQLEKAALTDSQWVHMALIRTYRDPRCWFGILKQGLLRILGRRISSWSHR